MRSKDVAKRPSAKHRHFRELGSGRNLPCDSICLRTLGQSPQPCFHEELQLFYRRPKGRASGRGSARRRRLANYLDLHMRRYFAKVVLRHAWIEPEQRTAVWTGSIAWRTRRLDLQWHRLHFHHDIKVFGHSSAASPSPLLPAPRAPLRSGPCPGRATGGSGVVDGSWKIEWIAAVLRDQEEQVCRIDLFRHCLDRAVTHSDDHDCRMHRRRPIGRWSLSEARIFVFAGVSTPRTEVVREECPQSSF